MPNLYGDILSDVAAQIAGSVGLAGSANIGDQCAMFEAIHGSAPRRAGQNMANPSGLLHGGLLMLVHIDQPDVAELIHNAWLRTIEDGVHTYDLYKDGVSKQKVGTKEFADAVVARLGKKPEHLKQASYSKAPNESYTHKPQAARARSKKELVGVDVFLDWNERSPSELGKKLEQLSQNGVKLTTLSNRGVKVYPGNFEETFCSDHWRARFVSEQSGTVSHEQVVDLLGRMHRAGFDFIKTENLYTFDGAPGYVGAQGE